MVVFPLSRLRRRLIIAGSAIPIFGWLSACGRSQAADTKTNLQPLFLTQKEYDFIVAACGRLIPDGEDGLGAVAARVPFFIDRQLAGPYGKDEQRYSEGPWSEGHDEQGYQLRYSPAELYRLAIADINAYCEKKHQHPFADLGTDEQDSLLHQMEKGDMELEHLASDIFFKHLWQNTKEGFLADPMYGGNRDFAGWRLIGYPGPRYNYVEEISQHGKPYEQPFVGLLGRDGSLIKEELWP